MDSNYYKDQFRELVSPFIEAGFLKAVYEDNHVCICNLANTTYVLFSYQMMSVGKENFVGILFNGMYLEKVAKNPELLLKDFVRSDDKRKQRLMVPLNYKSWVIMEEMKRKTDLNGHTNEINPELEERIREKSR